MSRYTPDDLPTLPLREICHICHYQVRRTADGWDLWAPGDCSCGPPTHAKQSLTQALAIFLGPPE